MTRRYLSILLFGLFMLVQGGQVQAGIIEDALQRGVLKVGTNPTYVPFQMTAKDGRIIGFEIDLLEEMSKAMGVRLELVPLEFSGLIPALLAGEFDLVGSGMTLTQERNLRVNFSDAFIIVGQTLILSRHLAGKVETVEDLNRSRYRIAVKADTTGEIVARKLLGEAHLQTYADELKGVEEVIAGKADAFIHDAPYNLVAINRLGEDKLVYLDQPFTYEPLAFALRKGDADALNWINHFLQRIAEDGTYDRIHDKWFKSSDWLAEIE